MPILCLNKERIYDVLDKVEQVSSSELRQLWYQVMNDMYGNEKQNTKNNKIIFGKQLNLISN